MESKDGTPEGLTLNLEPYTRSPQMHFTIASP